MAYYCIKTIKGRRYLYWQRIYRKGGRVCTESRYVRPVEGAAVPKPVLMYHGTRSGIPQGTLTASETGVFGPGLYVAPRARAEKYARYLTEDDVLAPDAVHEINVAGLKFKTFADGIDYTFFAHQHFPKNKQSLDQADTKFIADLLHKDGYDGIRIRGQYSQTVIFPQSLSKINHPFRSDPQRP